MPKSTPAYFSPETFRFLKELAKHNDRDWFQANKPRYEEAVLQPAVRFVGDLGARLARSYPHITYDARPFGGSVSRIYRDTRFSKDKSPYRTNVGIHFGHDAGGDEHLPGFFLHIAPGESVLYSGLWRPDPPQLKRIRDAIVADRKGWAKVRKSSPPVGGESYARVPAGYGSDDEFGEDLRRKDFFASREFTDAEVASGSFDRSFLAGCAQLDPLNSFLAKAVGVEW